MRRFIPWVLIGVLATGCATAPPRPAVHAYPAQGQSGAQVARDHADCQAWATQQTGFDPVGDSVKGAGIGALLGAATGAAIGAAAGSAGTGAAIGAATGGIGGGALGYTKTKGSYDRAFAVCMEARGYHVR